MLRFPDGSCVDVGIGRPGSDSYFEIWDWSARQLYEPTCPTCGDFFGRIVVFDGSGPDLSGPVTITDVCENCGVEQQEAYYLHGLNE